MWIVCVKRNYYPVVEEFATEEGAVARYNERMKELSEDGNLYHTCLYIANVSASCSFEADM